MIMKICRFVGKSPRLCCKNEPRTEPVVPASPPPPVVISSNLIPDMNECGFSTSGRITDGQEIVVRIDFYHPIEINSFQNSVLAWISTVVGWSWIHQRWHI